MALGSSSAAEAKEAATKAPNKELICFIIRTYWGHGDTWGDKSLRRILTSLQNQTDARWEAMLLVMDNRPFPELRKIVREVNDSRIWVHSEWISYKYAPKEGGTWAPTYHNKLYNLTDQAIRSCPEHSTWVVVTNGDNLYDKRFVEAIFSAPSDVDAVAVDFYSRYQRPTSDPCERFEEAPDAPPCKENLMRFCQTDLAANAYRVSRLLSEDRRFGTIDPGGTHGANDGIMAQTLKSSGWKIHYFRGRCLVNHAPSPQQCALSGGIWDDSIMCQASSFGGACVTAKSVVERMRTNPELYELVELNVTHDRHSFTYGNKPYHELKCLRLANRTMWYQAQTYGRVCAARMDVKNLPENMPEHPWDSWVPLLEAHEDGPEYVPEGTVIPSEGAKAEGDGESWHPIKAEGKGKERPDGDEHVEL
ncbi:hypothetical protein HYH03_000808 [Edaphochlamys debaryana]|uniref:Uncharacterized protein n=1 Tax=Edaphochlamys debaryana TaxID=47281 RepID=A0A835YE98_9CHLO|nr:hypothetical protein HYH03_000808 [Edaphochlamys debaryana]|eukprot:KAG2500986.1 hypothetical protein HYH03_000808 [Edaphochlamys debaryana]